MGHRVRRNLARVSFGSVRRPQSEQIAFRLLQGRERIDVLENLTQVVREVIGLRVRESESSEFRNLKNLFAADRHVCLDLVEVATKAGVPDQEPLGSDGLEVDRDLEIPAKAGDLADRPRTKGIMHDRLPLHEPW